jgi:hypothetical protein
MNIEQLLIENGWQVVINNTLHKKHCEPYFTGCLEPIEKEYQRVYGACGVMFKIIVKTTLKKQSVHVVNQPLTTMAQSKQQQFCNELQAFLLKLQQYDDGVG